MSQGEVRWVFGAHAVQETLLSRPQSVRQLWVEHELRNPAVGAIVKAA